MYKMELVSLRKCPCDYSLTNKAYLIDIIVKPVAHDR